MDNSLTAVALREQLGKHQGHIAQGIQQIQEAREQYDAAQQALNEWLGTLELQGAGITIEEGKATAELAEGPRGITYWAPSNTPLNGLHGTVMGHQVARDGEVILEVRLPREFNGPKIWRWAIGLLIGNTREFQVSATTSRFEIQPPQVA
jgi:hypothetical protein